MIHPYFSRVYCSGESLSERQEHELQTASLCQALISKMLLMTYLWSQSGRTYWSECQIIGWLSMPNQARTKERGELKYMVLTSWLSSLWLPSWPLLQTLPSIKVQRSRNPPQGHPTLTLLGISFHFQDNIVYTQKMKSFLTVVILCGEGERLIE